MKAFVDLLRANEAGTVSPTLIAEVEDFFAEADVGYLMSEIPNAIEGIGRVAKIVQATPVAG